MTEAETWVGFKGLIATTHRIPAYGGLALHRDALEDVVRAVNAGDLSMRGHHDALLPMRTRGVEAHLRELQDGEFGVEVSGEVRPEDWARLGPIRGFSIAAGHDLDVALWAPPLDPDFTLAADAAWFDPADIAEASEGLSRLGGVRAQEYFQFSTFPDAKIVIETSLNVLSLVGPNLACSALWDAIKLLWNRRRTPAGANSSSSTTIELHVTDGDRRLTAVVRTDEQSVAAEALKALPQVVQQVTSVSTNTLLSWQPVNQGDPRNHWAPPS